jgi:hypothetical protein
MILMMMEEMLADLGASVTPAATVGPLAAPEDGVGTRTPNPRVLGNLSAYPLLRIHGEPLHDLALAPADNRRADL